MAPPNSATKRPPGELDDVDNIFFNVQTIQPSEGPAYRGPRTPFVQRFPFDGSTRVESGSAQLPSPPPGINPRHFLPERDRYPPVVPEGDHIRSTTSYCETNLRTGARLRSPTDQRIADALRNLRSITPARAQPAPLKLTADRPAQPNVHRSRLVQPVRPGARLPNPLPRRRRILIPRASVPLLNTPPLVTRTLAEFCAMNIRPLFPSDAEYPSQGTVCPICQSAYSCSHPPVLIHNLPCCRGHIFGYGCLRKWISSGKSGSDHCLLCRTKWFNFRRVEVREISRTWARIEKEEDDLVKRDEEAFKEVLVRQAELAEGFGTRSLRRAWRWASWAKTTIWG